MRILSISTVFPNTEEPGLGLFVRARLESLARLEPCVVVAPVPALDFARPVRRWWRRPPRPAARRDGALTVLHPRWLYPPGGTPVTALCLFLRLAALLIRLRRRIRFDVIDAHFGYPEGVAAALLAMLFRVPFAVTLRGSETAFAAWRWRRLSMRWALRRASAVIAVSEPLRRFAVSMGARRVVTIPNGIDAGVFQAGAHEAARAALGIRPEKRVVVSAGELIEAKGHHLVIGAAAALSTGRPPDRGVYRRRGLPRRAAVRTGPARTGRCGWAWRARCISPAGWTAARWPNCWPPPTSFAWRATPRAGRTSCTRRWHAARRWWRARVGAIPDMIPGRALRADRAARGTKRRLRVALARALDREWDRAAIAARGQSRSWSEVAREAARVLQGLCAASGESAQDSRVNRRTLSTMCGISGYFYFDQTRAAGRAHAHRHARRDAAPRPG